MPASSQLPSRCLHHSLGVCLTFPSTLLGKNNRQRGKEGAGRSPCHLKCMAPAAVPESSLCTGSSTDSTCDSAVSPLPKGPGTGGVSSEMWREGATPAGDALPMPQPYSSTTQPLCSDSSRTTASSGRGSFPSQLRGGTHLKGCFCGNIKAELVSGAPLGYIISATLQQLSYPALSKSWTG